MRKTKLSYSFIFKIFTHIHIKINRYHLRFTLITSDYNHGHDTKNKNLKKSIIHILLLFRKIGSIRTNCQINYTNLRKNLKKIKF